MTKRFMPIVAAFLVTFLTWALVSYWIEGEVRWITAMIFAVTFSIVFGVLWWRRAAREVE